MEDKTVNIDVQVFNDEEYGLYDKVDFNNYKYDIYFKISNPNDILVAKNIISDGEEMYEVVYDDESMNVLGEYARLKENK